VYASATSAKLRAAIAGSTPATAGALPLPLAALPSSVFSSSPPLAAAVAAVLSLPVCFAGCHFSAFAR